MNKTIFQLRKRKLHTNILLTAKILQTKYLKMKNISSTQVKKKFSVIYVRVTNKLTTTLVKFNIWFSWHILLIV